MTLEKKYNIISSKQKVLIEKIVVIEQNYKDVGEYNQSLLLQIMQSNETESKIEELLILFTERLKDVPQFLHPFMKKKKCEIVRPIAVRIHQQFRY